MIKQLDDLEQKVLALVANSKSMKEQLAAKDLKIEELQASVASLEASLLKESGATAELSSEKDLICSSLDSLLESIDDLGVAEEQQG